MSKDPAQPGEGADDLFGRWLAHREKPGTPKSPSPERADAAVPSADKAAAPRTGASTTPPLSTPAPPTPQARATGSSTVDRRDGLGPVVAPSSFGVRRGLPGSAFSGPMGTPARNDGVAELDRPSPIGFEPIVIASLRNKEKDKA
ncbi:hypothetical protein, partial [Nocardioides sp.]|uniref:hypothetical protein n=1 Tax=Nocardioides sp. TaxID=35761 RepID=UPI003567B216